ncbi:MAG: ABC transporter substrate-binding protein [Pseudolabrys sp.]
MRRREFITLLGGAATWPLVARAQQPTMPVIGFLNGASPKAYAQSISGFLQGLKEMGYIEGQNVTIEYRWAEGRYARLQEMAADLIRGQVSVIVANTPAAPVAKAATTNIPIVFLSGDDPVANGLVASLNRPGGNVTGISLISGVLGGKQLGVLHELIPSARSIAFLTNPTNPISTEYVTGAQEAARNLGAEIHVVSASTEAEIDKAFASLSQLRADALVVAPDTFFIVRRDRIVALAANHATPTIYPFREFAVAGGLMSYGANLPDLFRQAGIYAGRILKGTRPADLPVTQPTTFELLINLKTAKALGIAVPPTLLARADEVIE